MIFLNRDDAGDRLGAMLRGRGMRGWVVLGIPRGGVVVAARVAEAIEGELGVVVAKKLPAPGHPELAIGAVASDGSAFVDHALARRVGADDEYLRMEIELQSREARRRELAFDGRARTELSGREVVLVDDGIATGSTAIAAARSTRAAGAGRVMIAAPVSTPDRADRLRREADEVVCLVEDPRLFAIGQYYQDFASVEDDEVRDVLRAFAESRASAQRVA